MENHIKGGNDPKAIPPIENDYPHHEEDPGVSPEAVFEENEEGAGQALKWILPTLVLVLIIAWLLFTL